MQREEQQTVLRLQRTISDIRKTKHSDEGQQKYKNRLADYQTMNRQRLITEIVMLRKQNRKYEAQLLDYFEVYAKTKQFLQDKQQKAERYQQQNNYLRKLLTEQENEMKSKDQHIKELRQKLNFHQSQPLKSKRQIIFDNFSQQSSINDLSEDLMIEVLADRRQRMIISKKIDDLHQNIVRFIRQKKEDQEEKNKLRQEVYQLRQLCDKYQSQIREQISATNKTKEKNINRYVSQAKIQRIQYLVPKQRKNKHIK